MEHDHSSALTRRLGRNYDKDTTAKSNEFGANYVALPPLKQGSNQPSLSSSWSECVFIIGDISRQRMNGVVNPPPRKLRWVPRLRPTDRTTPAPTPTKYLLSKWFVPSSFPVCPGRVKLVDHEPRPCPLLM